MTCMTISLVQSLSQELSSESGKLVARRCDVRQEQEVKEVFQFARAHLEVWTCVSTMLTGSLRLTTVRACFEAEYMTLC